MNTFGTGYSDWDAAEQAWAEAKAKRETTTGAPERTPHGDPLAGALDQLSPEDDEDLDGLPYGFTPEEVALAAAREVISDTLFELGHVLHQLGGDHVVKVHVPRVAGILRQLYRELNEWANAHDLAPVDFPGRNDEDLS